MKLLHGILRAVLLATSSLQSLCFLRPHIYERQLTNIPAATSDRSSNHLFDVCQFGAKAGGHTDATQAFSAAWNAACNYNLSLHSVVRIPKGNFLLNPISFKGPCRAPHITVQIIGNLTAPRENRLWDEQDLDYWLHFKEVNGLIVEGGGSLHGNGDFWWNKSCKADTNNFACRGPASLKFSQGRDIVLRNMTSINSKQMHIIFDSCYDVKVHGISIHAPGNSPNTDGIHIQRSSNVIIQDVIVGTGDDCISVGTGSTNVHLSHITCGPGHGISVGSLGRHDEVACVRNVHVNHVSLFGTQNGLRIKTWQGGRGSATGFTFHNVQMKNVRNPIIIDQYYCPHSSHCPSRNETSNVHISNVSYKNIYGTSATKGAVKFSCSESVPCRGITMQNVHLIYANGGETSHDKLLSICKNAKGISSGIMNPSSCLSPMPHPSLPYLSSSCDHH